MAVLAACTPQDGGRPEPATPPSAPADAGDTCGASKVQRYIGMTRSDTLIALITSASGARTVRVVGPNDMMTMDFREDRLTVTTDEDGQIKTLRCV